MPMWQKLLCLALISIFSTLGLALVNGFGGLLGFYIPQYTAEGKDYSDITNLMTMPTLFMGIGNLIGMPLAIGVGRRSVLLASSFILVLAAGLCAAAKFLVVWSGLGAVLAGVEFLLAFFLLPETKYERSLASYQEDVPAAASSPGNHGMSGKMEAVIIATQRVPLDFETYPRRTWKSDMKLWTGKPNWGQAWPNVHAASLPKCRLGLLLNGLTLGGYIAIGTTYNSIVTAPPYNWPDTSASYVNCGQIVVALIALPLLGHGSDWLANIVLYGQAAALPESYHWFIYIWGLAAYNFCFVGANIGAITYLLDSYPGSEGPILIIICAFRGIISFGTSYGISPFVERNGYDGAFGIFGALTFVLGVMGIPIYLWRKQIRKLTARFGRVKG
ncbi:major facilitator superfamily domain-containing protein [Aspergillus germanicus]